uniref:Uncharacterized protein n=1 Tax=Panagrolaimus sp. PS1159 TaxID=55785 RepID=A0AC35GAT0_9BILA
MVGDFKYMDKKNPDIELGSASCCETDLCNDETQKPVDDVFVVDAPKSVYNSATKNYSLIGFFIFLVSVPFFLT